MIFTIGWSVFVHFMQLCTKRASCAVPLRIVTIKANGALTPSQPPIINIIPDQDPLIQGRRQQTPHPPPARRKSYEDSLYDSSETEEFPNQYNYTGYYYDKDYFRYSRSHYEDNGEVGFHFKHPRYPFGHTLFAPALAMKQVPAVFKDVFFPTEADERISSILVGDFYTQTVPFEMFPAKMPERRHRRVLNRESKPTTILKPQTKHRIQRNRPSENIKSHNYQSVISYYDRRDESKDKSNKAKMKSADKKHDKKNFQSISYYAYNEDENVRPRYSSPNNKRPNPEERPMPNRRLNERFPVKSTPSRQTRDIYSIPGDPQAGPPGLVSAVFPDSTEAPLKVLRQGDPNDPIPQDPHEFKIEKDSPYELYMPGAAAMAVAPAISFFKDILRG